MPPHCGSGMYVLSRRVIVMARMMRTARARVRAMLLPARRRKEGMVTMGTMMRIMMLTRKVMMPTTMMMMKRNHVGCFVDHCYRAAMPVTRRAHSQPYEAKTTKTKRKRKRKKRKRMMTWGRTWKRMPVWPMLMPSLLHRVAPPLGVALPPPQLPPPLPPLRSPPPAAPVVCGRLG